MSQDRSIAIWVLHAPNNIKLQRIIFNGHSKSIYRVDFDQKYIISASGDKTIKIWLTSSADFVRTLSGHTRGIDSLKYRDGLAVSGSSDNSIR